jgi:Flp pilus assembly protein TadB
MIIDPGAILPALCIAGAGVALLSMFLRPTPRLAPRLRAYNSANRTRLGREADVGAAARAQPALSGGALKDLFGPIVGAAAAFLGRLVDRETDAALLLRLRRAGMYRDVPERDRLNTYRTRRLGFACGSVAAYGAVGLLFGNSFLLLLCLACGTVFGIAYPRSRINAAIKTRQEQMRIDLYTVNEHLANYQETGSSVDDALTRLVRRGRGPVIEELAEALTWRRAGIPLSAALERAAELTAEPHAARTYKSLAKAAGSGAEIGDALRHLSRDVRAARRDALERVATTRRATMIAPMVLLLMPPLILLIGAPIPAQLFGSLR